MVAAIWERNTDGTAFALASRMTKLLLLSVSLLIACAGSSSPPASAPSPAPTGVEPVPTGAAEAQGGTERDGLEGELAAIEVRLTGLGKQLEVARDDVRSEVQLQLVVLRRRDAELRARLVAFETSADADAERTRREIHGAIRDLRREVTRLTERVPR
jgi:hypothetical protein